MHECMPKSQICVACHKPFLADFRSASRQKFCRKIACQKARRTRSQRQRRHDRTVPVLGVGSVRTNSRLLKPTEVDWLANHPLFIGLVMQFLGSCQTEDIRQFMFKLTEKGLDIVSTPDSGKKWKPLIIGHIQSPRKYIRPKR